MKREPRGVLRRAMTNFRLAPYLMTTAFICLAVLAAWALIDLFLGADDTVVIEVVPLSDDRQMRVQVEGAVAQPGVYLLPRGSTHDDAIAAAGGYLDGALVEEGGSDVALTDGAIISIPHDEDGSASQSGPVNINTASAEELETLPGIGPALAARIIAYREAHGPFASAEDLAAVSGVSDRMVAELRGQITLGTP